MNRIINITGDSRFIAFVILWRDDFHEVEDS